MHAQAEREVRWHCPNAVCTFAGEKLIVILRCAGCNNWGGVARRFRRGCACHVAKKKVHGTSTQQSRHGKEYQRMVRDIMPKSTEATARSPEGRPVRLIESCTSRVVVGRRIRSDPCASCGEL